MAVLPEHCTVASKTPAQRQGSRAHFQIASGLRFNTWSHVWSRRSITRRCPRLSSRVRAWLQDDRHPDQIGQAASLELFDNVRAMQLDRPKADAEMAGD